MKKFLLVVLLFCSIVNAGVVSSGIIGIDESSYEKIDTVFITATGELTIYGILYDADKKIISDSAIINSVKWEICGGDLNYVKLSNAYGNKITVSSNQAYSQVFIKMTCNNIPLDTIVAIFKPLPAYKVCIDTVPYFIHPNGINQITMMSDSIRIYVYAVDEFGNFIGSLMPDTWTVLDPSQLTIEIYNEIPSKSVIRAKINSINTNIICKVDSNFTDTIHIVKNSLSVSHQRANVNRVRYENVSSYNLLGKKINTTNSAQKGCLMIHLNQVVGRPVSQILVK